MCDIFDIIDGLVNNNLMVTKMYNDIYVLISMVKQKQSPTKVGCICVEELFELLENAGNMKMTYWI